MRFAILSVLAACYAPSPSPGAPCGSAGECPSGLVCGPTNVCELPGTAHDDAEVMTDPDGGMPFDAAADAPSGMDAAVPMPIARYRFDDDLTDDMGVHHAVAVGSGVTYVTGYTNKAVYISPAGESWVRIADSPDFDLPAGKIELRFKYGSSTPASDVGLLSRDATRTETNGHLAVTLGKDRRVAMRMQVMSDPSISRYLCTADPVTANTWHHLEIEFGPPDLVMRVDGQVASGTSWKDHDGDTHVCGGATPWTTGIDGNDNPIVIGGKTSHAAEGTGMPVEDVAADVAFDDLVIWAAD